MEWLVLIIYLLLIALGIYVFYFITKLAVKNALLKYDRQKQER